MMVLNSFFVLSLLHTYVAKYTKRMNITQLRNDESIVFSVLEKLVSIALRNKVTT